MTKLLYIGHLKGRSYGDQVAFTLFRDYIAKKDIELSAMDIQARKNYAFDKNEYDFYLLGGGTCISDLFRPYADRVLHGLHVSGCRYGILGAGVFSEAKRNQKGIVCERTKESVKKTKDFIEGAEFVAVRDTASVNYLKNAGVETPIINLYDPCLTVNYPKVPLKLNNKRKKVIGFNICLNNQYCLGTIDSNQSQLFENVKAFIKHYSNKYHFLYIPFNRADAKLGAKLKGCDVAEYGTPEHIAGVMQNCDYYMGMRVHGDVTAAAYNIPFLSIGYTVPNIHFLEHIKYPYYINVAEVTTTNLISMFEDVLNNEEDIKELLAAERINAIESYNNAVKKLCDIILGNIK